MITVIVRITVKKEMLSGYQEIVSLLSRKFRGRPGCISYTFHQNINRPTDFVLHEQWESQSDLDSHYDALVALIGPAKPGQVFPERLMNMYHKAVPSFYRTL